MARLYIFVSPSSPPLSLVFYELYQIRLISYCIDTSPWLRHPSPL
ncbi:hypothetical protein [Scytonema sp. PCC 10023]